MSGNSGKQNRPGSAKGGEIISKTFTMRRLDVLYEKNKELLNKWAIPMLIKQEIAILCF